MNQITEAVTPHISQVPIGIIKTRAVIMLNGKIFLGKLAMWDFYCLPGGTLEYNETLKEGLRREIIEELDTEIAVHNKIGTIEYDYPTFHLSMDCFWCTVVSGELVLKEAEAARWQTKDELDSVQWIPADRTILKQIQKAMQ